jgi:tRNA(adenine34) deaminase
MVFEQQDTHWLQLALELAKQAAFEAEVPVGALVILGSEIIGRGYNQPIKSNDPTAHAEIIALREAGKHIKNYRLLNATLYVTLEPCAMCTGSLLHARIKRLVFGAYDQKAGAIVSRLSLLADHNYPLAWRGGVLASECALVLQDFFRERRQAG